MRTREFLVRTTAATGLALTLAAAAPLAASADSAGSTAPTAAPAAGCAAPVVTAEPVAVSPGTVLTVSGTNFSGCPNTDGVAPTALVPVVVGIATDAVMSQELAHLQTAADGSFSVQVTVPAVPSAGDRIGLIAASTDEATGLVYTATVTLGYTPGGSAPTAVPAGVGDLAAGAGDGEKGVLIGLGAAGVLLVAGGTTVAVRRREPAGH